MNEFVFTSRHTGDTPFKCDICKKSFTRKEHYVNHYMWHTGDYILQIVKSSAGKILIYSFVYFYLIGETPHTCNVCGKKYTRKGMLLHKLWQIHIWGCSLWPIAYLRLFFFWRYPNFVHLNNYNSLKKKIFSHLQSTWQIINALIPAKIHSGAKYVASAFHARNTLPITYCGEWIHLNWPISIFVQEIFFRILSTILIQFFRHTGETPHRCDFCSKVCVWYSGSMTNQLNI